MINIEDDSLTQAKQDRSKPNNSIKNKPHINNETKQEIEYFIPGPGQKLIEQQVQKQH